MSSAGLLGEKRMLCCTSPAGTRVVTSGRSGPCPGGAASGGVSSAAMDHSDTCGTVRVQGGQDEWWTIEPTRRQHAASTMVGYSLTLRR